MTSDKPGGEQEPKWHHFISNRGAEAEGWRHRGVWLHGPEVEAHAEWRLLARPGHGWGFNVGRNGTESDLGIDVFAGRLGSLWLRIRSPWTRWLQVRDRQAPHWYEARHYGIRLWPYDRCWVRVRLGASEGMGPQGRRRREWSLSTRTFLGLNRTEAIAAAAGATRVPLPEGVYGATWTERIVTTRYTAPLGRLRDAVLGPRRHRSITLEIPGGIPVEGKGENSWDCGMDGVFGTSGRTVEDAVANAVRAVLRGRENYGGPHNLTEPTPVSALNNGADQ